MSPRQRAFVLTIHVITSVGWIGAAAAFLALGVTALTATGTDAVRGALGAMVPITWFVLVPLAAASLMTGLVSSLGTAWGLFRHYWIVAKLALTITATTVLLVYTKTVDQIAAHAADPDLGHGALRDLAVSPVLHASGGLVLLIAAAILGVYKPKGLTRYGWQRQRDT